MKEKDYHIAARCPECGEIYPIKYKFRNQSICKACFELHGALVHLRPLLKSPIDIEVVAVLQDDYVTWKDYKTRSEEDKA
jgi:hypothetical protein